MENKYYTPNLEDLYIGYQYESYYNGVWKKYTFDYSDFESMLPDMNEGWIRTKYLSKEDILADGWVFTNNSETWQCPVFKKDNWMLFFNGLNIWIQLGNQLKFDGDCPSINEFKKIIKWLKI